MNGEKTMSAMKPLGTIGIALLTVMAVCLTPSSLAGEVDSQAYLKAAERFADTVLEHGRDRFGAQETPLFVDGLQVETLEPAVWKKDGEAWVLCNFASQQPLMRLLDGLSALTGEEHYRQAAVEATSYALENLVSESGLLYWGGHRAWDLRTERSVGQYDGIHEMKGHQPYYALMWEVNEQATRELLASIWAGHILDWKRMDYNRHADMNTDKPAQWDHEFAADLEIPFPAQGNNLSFVNVTPSLLRSGTMLALLDGNREALNWSLRLAKRWQQAKHPQTGLSGGQLSYRKKDRAQEALGHVHPTINEAQIVATYHQTCRYHEYPLAQMQAGERLLAREGPFAQTGQTMIDWAVEDLKIYGRECYDPESGQFIAKMIDGTPLQWQEAKSGYYVPESFTPRNPDGYLFWGYAMAYRLSKDPWIWRMTAETGQQLGLGDFDQPDRMTASPPEADWRLIYGLLELHRATGHDVFLRRACQVADALLETQTETGLFPQPGRLYSRTGNETPLALLHLAAALDGQREQMPQPVFDFRFFHCEFHGELEEHQQKRYDNRTYDQYVFYGSF